MTKTAIKKDYLPPVRGRITESAPLGAIGWFKAGGVAEVLFKPADLEDLKEFLAALPPDVPVNIFGVLSNTIIRDGGVKGVTIRLGKEFTAIEALEGHRVRAGALALDASVAKAASDAGTAGLEFYSGIPGAIGGALRMNAGCYGTETKDVLIEASAIDRRGRLHIFKPSLSSPRKRGSDAGAEPGPRFRGESSDVEMELSYRRNDLPEDYIFTGALFQGVPGDPKKIAAHMAGIRAKREQTQPIREATGGSTFANPSAMELSQAGLPEGTKVWQLIDRAKCRGLTIGGAQMSELHCNFMINTGGATAADLENLGEEVRRRVYEDCGITLRWEIKRIGERV